MSSHWTNCREDALQDITLETPVAEGSDLLVRINAVSVNPVNTRLRQRQEPEAGGWVGLGYDAAGKIDAATLRAIHAQIESGSARGKILLEGF